MRTYTKKSLSLFSFVLIFGAILVMVNILGLGLWGRLDLTEDKVYSLSDGTRAMLKSMDDQVEIRAYFSRDLPSHLGSLVQYVKDQLDDYKAYSGGKVSYRFLDPAESKDIEDEANGRGCPPLTLQQMSSDQYATQKVYMCLTFFFEDKKEVIPAVRSTEGLEYEITSILKKVTARSVRQVGILQGHGEPNLQAPEPNPMQPQEPEAGLSGLNEALGRNYKVVPVDTTSDAGLAKLEELDTLLVIAPTTEIKEQEQFAIDQFIMKGKTVAFFLDRVSTDLRMFTAAPRTTGLEGMLTSYGVTLNDDLVMDKFNQPIAVSQQAGNIRYQTRMPYPFFVLAGNFNDQIGLNPEQNMVLKLEKLILPFVSTLTLSQSTDARKVDWLVRSSQYSWKQLSGRYTINPMQIENPAQTDVTGPYNLAAVVTGSFDSFFSAKADSPEPYMGGKEVIKKSSDTRIFVMANGALPQDRFMDPGNMQFIENLVDWLVQDESLISIRSRGFRPEPLDPEMSAGHKALIKYGNIVGVPALFLLLGVVLTQLRAARKRRLAATFFTKSAK